MQRLNGKVKWAKSPAKLRFAVGVVCAIVLASAGVNFRAPVDAPVEHVPGFLWIEAEAFSDYGGWEIDTQFIHTMGSAYLISKGVLNPLAPAKTEVTIPSSGIWRAWVRTKDWLPEHSPPGSH